MCDSSDRQEPTGEPTEQVRAGEQPEARKAAASEAGVASSDDTLPEVDPTLLGPAASWSGYQGYQQPGEGWSSWPPSGWPPGPGYVGGHGSLTPQRGIVPPRPLAVGDIFAGACAYIRANPLLTLGSAAIVVALDLAAIALITFLIIRRLPSAAFVTLWPLGSVTVSIVLGSLLVGLLLVVLSRAVLGQRTDLGLAWRAAASRLPGLIGIGLLILLTAVAFVLIVVLPALLAYATGSIRGVEWVGWSFLLLLVVGPGYMYLAVHVALAPAAYVLEPIGVMAAFERSRRLVRGAWWQTFGVLALTGFAIVVPVIVVGGLAGLYTIYPFREPTVARMALSVVAFFVVNTFAVPFSIGVVGLVYTDRRIRRERFDVQIAQALTAGSFAPR